MVEQLSWEDYLATGLYFAVVLTVGIWSTFGRNRGSAKGYFLAGKSMTWLPVGASVYSSNVGAPMFVGLAGTAAISGIAVTIYEWHAVYIIISLGWIFVPVYIASGAYTIPEYLRKRFGGRRIRTYTSVVMLLQYVLRNISGEIYCGAIFMHSLLGWNLYACVSTILGVVAIYTVIGGLRAVIFTDTLQTGVLIVGSMIVCFTSLNAVGGWGPMVDKYQRAATNYTLANQSFYACGMPRQDSFHIFRDPVSGDIPWTGATFGLTVLALFVWCQDQLIVQRCLSAKDMSHAKGGTLIAAGLKFLFPHLIVQRCLSAKDMSHAKGGTLLAAGLKFLSFPMFVIPGLISRILYTDEIACADPEKCEHICNDPAGCSNVAYPLLVLRILPAGIRGLMLAALLAGLMSTLTSIFNSASSIVTLDLWGQYRKSASQAELMVVGRVTVLVLVGISILWLPILQIVQGGILWFYIAAITAYLAVPWCAAFLIGLFWKRTTEPGIFWGMMIGLVVGVVRMGLDFAIPPPVCGSGEPDRRLSITGKVDFLHFAIINFIICAVSMVTISAFTKPRTYNQLHRVTWWTRHDTTELELTDDEDEETPDSDKPKTTHTDTRQGCKDRACYRWVCGSVDDDADHNISAEERAAIRQKMTSIEETKFWKYTLNGIAIALMTAITFLFGFFG